MATPKVGTHPRGDKRRDRPDRLTGTETGRASDGAPSRAMTPTRHVSLPRPETR